MCIRDRSHSGLNAERPYNWTGDMVADMLQNMVYLGHTVNLRYSTCLLYTSALFLAALSATKQIQQSQGDFRIAVPIIALEEFFR